jgi:trehalose/maltose hydrolase-like predicted phosphorylase
LFLLQNEFTVEQMREAYDFYEPMTLHYSSLSYNTHAIIAAKIGRHAQAYDYFMKAAGLDLDNLRDATKDGLHAAALAGTWQTVVYGFLGMRIEGDSLVLDPRLPDVWTSLRLTLAFRGFTIRLEIGTQGIDAFVEGVHGRTPAAIRLLGTRHELADGMHISTKLSIHS